MDRQTVKLKLIFDTFGPHINKPQWQYITNWNFRHFFYIGGRGCGKTAGDTAKAITYMCKHPGSRGAVICASTTVYNNIIAPEWEKWLPRKLIRTHYVQKKHIILKNGSVVLFACADQKKEIDKLRGLDVAWINYHEACHLLKYLRDVTLACVRQPGYPHHTWAGTTPRKGTWVHDECKKGINQKDIEKGIEKETDTWYIDEIPSNANPYIDEQFIKDLTEKYSGAFYLQEVLGKWIALEGLVYPFDRDTHVWPNVPGGYQIDNIIYGVDWGFAHPFVCLPILLVRDKLLNPWVIIADEIYKTRMSLDDIDNALKNIKERYGDGRIYADPSEPQNIEELKQRGHDIVPALNDVMPGIQEVTNWYERDAIRYLVNCENTIKEHETYSYPSEEDIKLKQVPDRPLKSDDHACDAERYALYTYKFGGRRGTPRVIHKEEKIKRKRPGDKETYKEDPFSDLETFPDPFGDI